MAFLVSPGVNTSEIDLTASVPGVGTSTGGTIGFFNWGPANAVIQVSSENDLAQKFSKPDTNSAVSFLSAANFLSYGNDLRVVRVVNDAAGANRANNAVSNGAQFALIKNDSEYFSNEYQTANGDVAFAARYPGKIGNTLKVSVCGDPDGFATWAYRGVFDSAPNTSSYALSVTNNVAVKDEVHVVVVDEDGLISGVANTILERYSNLSKATDAKGSDNASIYYKEVLFRNSRFVHWMGHPAGSNAANAWGQTVTAVNGANTTFHTPNTAITTYSLVNGSDGLPTAGNYVSALDLLKNTETVDVSLLFAGDYGREATGNTSDTHATTVANAFLAAAEERKDCVAFVSPPYANAVTSVAKSTDVVNFRNGLSPATSYGVMDSGWKYQYDKYNDVYRWVPLNADIAGLCVRTDLNRDPWFSPAGLERGQIRNLVRLSWNPNQAERDSLYKAGVNPVVSFPGEGTILFGDKTLLAKPSAFDRINVRRLFITLEKAISRAARTSLFEFNDEFTRAQFVALVEPFLRDVQARRGIFDFRVVCDETNNTAGVIDRNEFVGDIYIKPARSVNFIQLNFVAVRSGVAFDEIVGRF